MRGLVLTLGFVAVLMIALAVTAQSIKPPTVRLSTDPIAAPTMSYACVDGVVIIHYTTGDGERLDPVPSNRTC